ncbi:MAG: hypothetical protein HY814_12660 [Candidatus Riflebacteria bacterium]|nr:hypothetical protein [Candidatus Riflebacteria bacterium]
MKLRLLLGAIAALAVLAGGTWAGGPDYPERLEERIQNEVGQVLGRLQYSSSYRTCLLTPDEVLVEVTLRTPLVREERRDSTALLETRDAVAQILSRRFPDVQLSELSSFRVRPSPLGNQMLALRPSD